MEITWFGQSAFKIKTKTATIIIDPFKSDKIGLPWKSQSADIVLISHDHDDHNNVAGVDGGFVATGPGEYEVKEILMSGVPLFHDAVKGAERGKNTAYTMEAEGITICHLGDVGHKLTGEQAEELSSADVVMVPVGGTYTVDGATAAEIVSQLEPKIVIPMHYAIPGVIDNPNLSGLEDFFKALGKEVSESVPSLKVGEKIGLPEEMQIVVLQPQK